MRLLITGICGFVGAGVAKWFRAHRPEFEIIVIDNFVRPGSETNRLELKTRGVTVYHGDLRNPSDFETLPRVDWVIDGAANPSVLGGVDGITSSRQMIEHNLHGTVNTLEYCKRVGSGVVLLRNRDLYVWNRTRRSVADCEKSSQT